MTSSANFCTAIRAVECVTKGEPISQRHLTLLVQMLNALRNTHQYDILTPIQRMYIVTCAPHIYFHPFTSDAIERIERTSSSEHSSNTIYHLLSDPVEEFLLAQ
jgi:hypothetical protein